MILFLTTIELKRTSLISTDYPMAIILKLAEYKWLEISYI